MAKHILVIDDDKELVEIYRRALVRAGYEVSYAYNGKEGLEKLKEGHLDLIVLDLKMPTMSGDEFLRFLRSTPEFKDIKVLVISSVLYRKKKTFTNIFFTPKEEPSYTTRIARRARRYGEKEGKFSMEEKLKPEATRLFSLKIKESKAEFRRRVSQALLRAVRAMIGEPLRPGGAEEEETELEGKIKDIIVEHLGVGREELTPDASFSQDLGIDVITDALDMVIDLEDKFNIVLEDDEVDKLTTVGELCKCIENKIKNTIN
jgi:acyl carrier protein